MRILFLAVAILAGGALSAEEIADYQSRDFAAESHQALATGDRQAAIVASLKGLPANPSEEDLQRFGEAYNALVRAAVSRTLRLDVPTNSVFEFDETGTRLASVGLFPSPDGDQSKRGLVLWDPRSGERIADLLPLEALTSGAWGVQTPAFSRDGRFLVQMAPVEGVAVVFDARTGEEIARLDGHLPGTIPNSGGVAFSRDDSLLLTLGASPTVAHLWRTSDWQRVASQEFGQFALLVPIDGGRDGGMHFLAMDVTRGNPPPLELWRIGPDGANMVLEFPAEPSGLGNLWGRVATDDADRLFAIPNGNFDMIVFERATGAEIGRLPASAIGGSIAVIAPSGDGVLLLSSMEELPRRLTFQGSDAALLEEDKLAGVHVVFSLGGEPLGASSDLFDYRGEDMPRGTELYDFVMESLPGGIKEEIAEQRVAPN